MRRWTMLLLIAALAAACAPAPRTVHYWDRPGGVDQAALAQDQAQCRSRAEMEVAPRMPGTKPEPGYLAARRAVIFRCMEEKGWVWNEKEVRPAPRPRYGY